MPQYKETPLDRNQVIMSVLEHEIEEDNIVRFLDAYVESLDMETLGVGHAVLADTGRRPMPPQAMLKLYLYGYLYSTRSSRRLARACKINREVQWLVCGLTPSYKTIAEFRRNNPEQLEKVFLDFVQFADSLNLYGKELLAVDGVKVRADNSAHKFDTRKKTEKKIAYFEEKIKEYLEDLDRLDAEEDLAGGGQTQQQLQDKLTKAYQRLEELKALKEDLPAKGGIAHSDPDSRNMRMNNKGHGMCHNIQAVADSRYKLVAAYDVVDAGTDLEQLEGMALRSKEGLLKETQGAKLLADKGYYSGEQISGCLKAGIEPIVAIPKTSATVEAGYEVECFGYDEEKDILICPMGKELQRHGVKDIRYYNKEACSDCKNRDKCTQSKEGYRRIQVNGGNEITTLRNAKKRYKENHETYRKRQEIIEHIFGNIKRHMGFEYFLLRGFRKVRAEAALIFTAYNIKRVWNILKGKGLWGAITASV